jgi:hypothetical protein
MTTQSLALSENMECPLCLGEGKLKRTEVLDRLGVKDFARVAQLSAEEAFRLLQQKHTHDHRDAWARFESELAKQTAEIEQRHRDELQTLGDRLKEFESAARVADERKVLDVQRVRAELETKLRSEESQREDLNRRVEDYFREITQLRGRNQELEAEMAKVARVGKLEEVSFADEARTWAGISVSEKLPKNGDFILAYRDPSGAPAQPKMLVDIRLSHECAIEGLWLAGLFETAYAFSWRNYELLGLRVSQLDFLARIIDLGETKNGDQRMLPMTEHLFQVLVRCASGKKPDDFVFTHDDGSQVKDFRGAWWSACIRAGLGRFECRECGEIVSEGRKCKTCNSDKKAKYVGLRFHDLRRTGVRNMSRKGVPEKVGMLISGHKTDSVYRRHNIVDMEVLKTATAKIEEHQREIVDGENSHRTAIVSTKSDAGDNERKLN